MDAASISHAMLGTASAVRAVGCRAAVPRHTHKGATLLLVDAGGRTLITSDATIRVRAGAGAVVPAGQAHAWSSEPAGCSYRAICIAPPDGIAMPAGPIRDQRWCDAFEAAYMAIEAHAADAGVAVRELIRLTRVLRPDSWSPPPEPAVVRRARRLTTSDVTAALRLDELAVRSGASMYHLHRLYRRLWGVTPAQHRLEARLRRARAALLAGESVADAAAESGFSDQSHFIRLFRRFMGVPPARWRDQIGSAGTVGAGPEHANVHALRSLHPLSRP